MQIRRALMSAPAAEPSHTDRVAMRADAAATSAALVTGTFAGLRCTSSTRRMTTPAYIQK